MFRNSDYIYAVYKAQSFSRAAETLYISQSSLSLTIKKAEERIGTPIFNRSTSPITLTEFGKYYINALEEIMRIQNQLEGYIYDVEHINRGHISIGAANFNSTYLLPPALSAFRQAYPNVTLDLYEGTTSDMVKRLSAGTLDLIVTKALLDKTRFQQFEICQGLMVLVIPEQLCPSEGLRSRALSKSELSNYHTKKELHYTLSDFAPLDNIPFVLLRPGNDTRECADHIFSDAGIRPPVALEVDQASTAYRLSCLGLGATIVSSLIIKKMNVETSPLFFPLNKPYCKENFCAYTRKDTITPWAMERFIKIARITIPASL